MTEPTDYGDQVACAEHAPEYDDDCVYCRAADASANLRVARRRVDSLRQQLDGAVPMTPNEARVLWRVAAGFQGAPQGTMWPALMDRLKAHAGSDDD